MSILRLFTILLYCGTSTFLGCRTDAGGEPPVMDQAALHCSWRSSGELHCDEQLPTGERDEVVVDQDTLPFRLSASAPSERVKIGERWALPTKSSTQVWVELADEVQEKVAYRGAFTVAALVRFDEPPRGRAAILSRWMTSGLNRSFELGVEWDGYPYFMVSPGGRARGHGIVYTDVPIPRTGEVLLSASFEPRQRLAVYANGVLLGDNRAVVPQGIHDPPQPLRVGSRRGCGQDCRWDGAIGDFFFFDRALGDDEHADLARELDAQGPSTLAWTEPEPEVYDLDELSLQLRRWYEELDTGQWPGAYRWKASDTEPQLYSSADIAWIRWIIGDLDELSEEERLRWIAYLQSFQNPNDGSYPPQRLHDNAHALAHVTVALSALGGRHRHDIAIVNPLLEPEGLVPWLESLDWYWQWGGSCTLWGYGMTLLSTVSTPDQWRDELFQWLDREVDPELGAWRRDHPVRHPVDWIGGGFHIWTLYASQGRPLPYPERIIDLSLALQRPDGDFDRKFGCGVLDGVWALAAANAQTGYRQQDVEAALRRSLHGLMELVERDLFETGSHGMLSRVATIAILQSALPDELRSSEPWRSPWENAALFELRVEE